MPIERQDGLRRARSKKAATAPKTSPQSAKHPPRPQHKLTRVEKSEQIRASLFRSAAEVVGEQGYLGASIAEITARAQVAQGTFYNYFESRQDLFDQLLPALGWEMLDFINAAAQGAADEPEREERRFRAFFAFLERRPEFYRILYEAELFSVPAFQQHMDTVMIGYTRVLRRAWDRGELPDFDPDELEVLACILLGARHYVAMRYARRDGRMVAVAEMVTRTYMKFLRSGVLRASEMPKLRAGPE